MTLILTSTQSQQLAGNLLLNLWQSDILSMAYEARTAADIFSFEHINFKTPADIPAGIASDDSTQTLYLLALLLHWQQLDLNTFPNDLTNALAHLTLKNHASFWENAVAAVPLMCQNDKIAPKKRGPDIHPEDGTPHQGSNYVVDLLHAAKAALTESSYTQAVRWAFFLEKIQTQRLTWLPVVLLAYAMAYTVYSHCLGLPALWGPCLYAYHLNNEPVITRFILTFTSLCSYNNINIQLRKKDII